MKRRHRISATTVSTLVVSALVLGGSLHGPAATWAQGMGDASWTPARSSTTPHGSRFLTTDDAVVYRTDAVWDRDQADGLSGYVDSGLRYTLEVNDRSGRLSATGFWATNYPDPAYDRDDDDGDGRWEEAEVIAGARRPNPEQAYISMVQFSRWHTKREKGECTWAWDRRLGTAEVLSQLSRELLGEWQAERYTLTYDSIDYPRVDRRPSRSAGFPVARCNDARAGADQHGFVVTFAEPVDWDDFVDVPGEGRTKWTAFEAIGSSDVDGSVWTCGGPVLPELGTRPCREMGVDVDGVVAAVGYLDDEARAVLDDMPRIAAVDGLQDPLTDLLLDVGGFGVERPGFTVNDRYWELFLAE
jgi:hypothetical protein